MREYTWVRIAADSAVPPLLMGRYGKVMHVASHTPTQRDGRYGVEIALWPEPVFGWVPRRWLTPLAPDRGARLAYCIKADKSSAEMKNLALAHDTLAESWHGLLNTARTLSWKPPVHHDAVLSARSASDFVKVYGHDLQACPTEPRNAFRDQWIKLMWAAEQCRLQEEFLLER